MDIIAQVRSRKIVELRASVLTEFSWGIISALTVFLTYRRDEKITRTFPLTLNPIQCFLQGGFGHVSSWWWMIGNGEQIEEGYIPAPGGSLPVVKVWYFSTFVKIKEKSMRFEVRRGV